MQRNRGLAAVLLLIGILLLPQFGPPLAAQAYGPPPTPQQLDQLLAPVALYPDSLLAQITTASTNPQEILDVDNWLAQNSGITGDALANAAQQQGFDPAFLALVNFPEVLQMMADNIDDYAAIGQAVTANQADVAASIQRLRAQAYASGALRSNQQQQVVLQQANGQTYYTIQPANPQMVYVPEYDPTVIYAGPSTGSVVGASLITFGVGIGIGALIASSHPWGWGGWGWNWGGRSIYYNHGAWGGWRGGYRPSNPWYRPRPIIWGSRPGYGGNWHYRPPNYRPPRPINRPIYRPGPGNRPGPGSNRPGNRPGYRPPANRPGGVRPPGNRPPNFNNRPVVRPPRPGPNPGPGNTTKPVPRPQPNRPSHSRPQQQHRPPAHHKPSHTVQRPAAKPAGGGGNRPQGGERPGPR